MRMDIDAYRRLRSEAGRHAHKAEDADDLLQDALMIALENGRCDAAWLAGVIRNQAAMQARSAIRRRQITSMSVPYPRPRDVHAARAAGLRGVADAGQQHLRQHRYRASPVIECWRSMGCDKPRSMALSIRATCKPVRRSDRRMPGRRSVQVYFLHGITAPSGSWQVAVRVMPSPFVPVTSAV